MNFQKTFILAVLMIFIISCNANGGNMPNKFLTTEDGAKIAYSLFPSSKDNPSVILLHMLNRNRHDYDELAKELQKEYNVISIDFRGHGESDGNWQKFGDKDFISMQKDVKAAKEFLKLQGYNTNRLGIIGASIGANTALNYGTADSDVKVVVLLSPGLEYRGVKTEESAKKYNKKMLIVASEGDKYSAESAQRIDQLSPADKELKIYEGSEHGTHMFGVKKGIFDLIKEWLGKGLKQQ